MCAYRSYEGRDHRPYPPRPRDDFYDDRGSHSRSRSPDYRNSSPRRRSPPHDINRERPQRYGRDQYNRDDRTRSPRSPRRHRLRSPDRGDFHKRRGSPSPRRGRNEYYDLDRPSRSRTRSRSRGSYEAQPSGRGRPSKEIMLEGLASHVTENDISTELQQNYHVTKLEAVRVIRDRQTRQSRQFGFVQFRTLEDAEAFMHDNYPHIYLYGQKDGSANAEDAKVRIAYGKERRETRVEESNWVCKICNIDNYATRARCFRCQSLKPENFSSLRQENNGDNDAAPDNTPSQFLLLRGLEASVSEHVLAKGAAKLNKPSVLSVQASQSQGKKGAKVASTTGDSNLGAKEGTLRRILLVRDKKTDESWRYGFAEYASIDDAQAALVRFNSFDRFTIASKQVLVSFIHAGVFIPVLQATQGSDKFTFSPLANPAMKLAYWDEEAYVAEHVVAVSELPQQDNKAQIPKSAAELAKATKETDKTRKRKAQDSSTTTAKKAAPTHLQFWSNRHAELHGIKPKDENSISDDTQATPSKSYADHVRKCCYLCMRQFESIGEVNRHERLSDLHLGNLKDKDKIKRAEHKLEKHGVQQGQFMTASAAEYRDRARERRKVYGVVNKKGEQVGGSGTNKLSKSRPDSDTEQHDPPPPPPSKGAALLMKMGYTAGSGLGVKGEGMTAPISQDVYVAGVGLGAQGGKVGDAVTEAERNTKGDYSAFAERTRDMARERYAQMGD